MPEKEGAEEKSTKSVVNKKQKQMMGEEGYDIARDMGRVRPSKDKKDATTMPVSDEVKKTQKVNKGPSALELVKKKYKGQIMNVGKKKVKEELDLTQVAEAFGGYIIEAQSGGKNKNIEKEIRGQRKISTRSLTGNIPPEERTVQQNVDDLVSKRLKGAEQVYRDEDPNSPTYGQVLYKTGDEDKGVTAQKDAAVKQTPEYQQAKKTGEKITAGGGLAKEKQFDTETRTKAQFEKDEAERARKRSTGRGDGRRAGRTPEERKTGKVTYQTFVNKPEVTGNVDAKDSGETVTYTTPDKRKKRSDVGKKRVKKDKVIVKQEPKIETKPQTQTAVDGDGGKEPPKVSTSTGATGGGKEPSLVSKIARFSKENPATALLSLDALKRFMPSSSPFGIRGGRVGTRSAPS